MTKLTVEIDLDQFDSLLVIRLREAYMDQILYWKNDPDTKKYCKGLKRTLEYFSVPSEHAEWLETVKDLG